MSLIRRYIFQFPKQWQNEKELLSCNGHKTKYNANTLNTLSQPHICASSISLIFLFLIKLHPSIVKLINHTQLVVMFTLTLHPKSLSQSIFSFNSNGRFFIIVYVLKWRPIRLHIIFSNTQWHIWKRKGSLYLFNVFYVQSILAIWIWKLIMDFTQNLLTTDYIWIIGNNIFVVRIVKIIWIITDYVDTISIKNITLYLFRPSFFYIIYYNFVISFLYRFIII